MNELHHTTSVSGVGGLLDLIGTELGVSRWRLITQEAVDEFAHATGDQQWIHTDVARAARGPFGTTIVHGYLTLALVAPLMEEVLTVEGVTMGVNYGVNKVRFPAPTPVGSMVRLSASLTGAVEVNDGVQVLVTAVIEAQGVAKPVCVGELVLRYYA